MRNVWKGLVIGALTGAGIGFVLDLLEWLGRRGKEISIEAKEGAQNLSAAARTTVEESDLPEAARAAAERAKVAALSAKDKVSVKVADTVDEVTQRLQDSDMADKLSDIASR
jgi:hypothetical protein